MSEELRFFLRVAVYTVVISVVYWFVSYERAGTILFVSVALAAVAFMGIFLRRAVGGRSDDKQSGPLGMIRRVVGFDDRGVPKTPLEVQSEPIATASIWPLTGAVAAALLGAGLVYGAWFWIPGLAVALSSAWGWITELEG